MAKKDLQAAAAATLSNMQGSTAQRMIQSTTAPAPAPKAKKADQDTKNDTPFTVWTTAENVRKWKAYQKAKKATIKTQANLVELALLEYMKAHPVTDEEKAELLATLEI